MEVDIEDNAEWMLTWMMTQKWKRTLCRWERKATTNLPARQRRLKRPSLRHLRGAQWETRMKKGGESAGGTMEVDGAESSSAAPQTDKGKGRAMVDEDDEISPVGPPSFPPGRQPSPQQRHRSRSPQRHRSRSPRRHRSRSSPRRHPLRGAPTASSSPRGGGPAAPAPRGAAIRHSRLPASLPAALPFPLPAALPFPLPAALPFPLPAALPFPLPAALPLPLPAALPSTATAPTTRPFPASPPALPASPPALPASPPALPAAPPLALSASPPPLVSAVCEDSGSSLLGRIGPAPLQPPPPILAVYEDSGSSLLGRMGPAADRSSGPRVHRFYDLGVRRDDLWEGHGKPKKRRH
ncbi:hypothetical protein B0H13DRAFT_2336865 [Mycena leptocephala]|nr:hypothetical protein B0H13DRAFT_2336865 [Mycena leptocephala]